jgi:hypothetical protein
VIAVRDHIDELDGLRPVVVSFHDDPERLAGYRTYLGIDFPIVADPERALYRALGAERGRLTDVWSFGTLRMYMRLVRQGRRLRDVRLLADDTRQLGADAIVDAHGRLTHLWLPDGPDHRPTIEQIAAAAG